MGRSDELSLVFSEKRRGCLRCCGLLTLFALITVAFIVAKLLFVRQELLREKITRQQEWILDYQIDFMTPLGSKNIIEVTEDVFAPLGYSIVKPGLVPTLKSIEAPNCEKILTSFKEPKSQDTMSPRKIPFDLKWQFILNGHVNLIEDYKTEFFLNDDDYDDISLEKALLSTGVRHQTGLIYGMATPKMESLLKNLSATNVGGCVQSQVNIQTLVLALQNVSQVTFKETIKESNLKAALKLMRIGAIKTLPYEFSDETLTAANYFDFIISLGYVESIGFGTHGEELEPDLDLRTVRKMLCLLKPGGTLIVSLPIGIDTVQWNQRRVYGRIRLALLTAGFELVEIYHNGSSIPITRDLIKKTTGREQYTNAIVVLKKL